MGMGTRFVSTVMETFQKQILEKGGQLRKYTESHWMAHHFKIREMYGREIISIKPFKVYSIGMIFWKRQTVEQKRWMLPFINEYAQ